MENLAISFNVISPIFFMLAIGYILKLTHIINENTIETMNAVSFKVLLPILLFESIYKTNVQTSFQPKHILTAVITILALFLLLCFVIPFVEKDNKKRSVLIQGIFRSNFVIFGLPITIALCGEENIGTTAILIAIIVPIYNALSVVALEIFRDNKSGEKKSAIVLRIIKGVITNPLIIAAAIGVIAMLLKITLPQSITSAISSISKTATPLALIMLGASFSFDDTKGYKKQLSIGVLSKLIIFPAICIPIFIMLGFRGVELAGLTVMIGAPTAVSTYTVAQQMGADHKLAGQLVVYDSIFSIVTMFFWVFLIKQLGLV